MSFDREIEVGMLAQELHVSLNGGLLVRTNVRLVVVEVHILDVLTEQVLVGNRGSRRRWRRRWSGNGQSRRSFLRSTRTLGDEMIRARIGRRNALRPVRLHRSNAVNRHVGRAAGLPRQGSRLPGLDRARVHGNRSGRGRRRRRWRWRRWRFLLSTRTQCQESAKTQNQQNPLCVQLPHLFLLRPQRFPLGPDEVIYYFQLQFGPSLCPVNVNCCTFVPSASID